MRRLLVAISLLLLNGCGSCLDDKKPEPGAVEPAVPPNATYSRPGVDGGPARVIEIGQGEGYAGFARARRDGGVDGGT